ncbi:hypothetical protein CK203_085446 [Vitis vinifera]|uniref:Uncharacterized protein n=1 Tax=Vitis vinifera TaxID=29760 RepID=A0A438BUG5_VITVI|nr:hypothetical protein CK203_085446 [Vitis vinifera]
MLHLTKIWEGFLGLVESDPRGSAVMGYAFFASNQSGLTNSLLNPSVSIPSPSTPLLPVSASQSLAPTEKRVNSEFFFKKANNAFNGQIIVDIPNSEMEVIQPACPNQMCESVNPLSASSKVAVNLGGIAGSPKGGFQIEGTIPQEMAKVRVFHMKIISWNTRGLGSKKREGWSRIF